MWFLDPLEVHLVALGLPWCLAVGHRFLWATLALLTNGGSPLRDRWGRLQFGNGAKQDILKMVGLILFTYWKWSGLLILWAIMGSPVLTHKHWHITRWFGAGRLQAFEGWFFGTANAGLDSVSEVDGFRSSMFFSGWSSKVFFPSHLQPWPGNENVQSPSTSKVLKSIRGMANWNQNICQIAEPSHRNRLFSIGKSSIYKWSRRHFAGYTPSFGPANGSLSSHVCRAHWCFAFTGRCCVYSRFADINVPAIYLCCVCVLLYNNTVIYNILICLCIYIYILT